MQIYMERKITVKLDALKAELDALEHLQAETDAELDDLVPAILAKAFKGTI